MDIMLVNTYYSPEIIGGAEISVMKLAEQLNKDGHKVTVLCTTKDTETQEYINGVKVIRIVANNFGRRYDLQFVDFSKWNIIKRKFYLSALYKHKGIYGIDTYNICNIRKFCKIIGENRPDIIHTNGLYEITPAIWRASHKEHVPVIHTLRDYYLLCIYGNLKQNGTEQECLQCNRKCLMRKKINRILCKNVNVFTSPSESTAQIFRESLGINPICIYNAIDLDMPQIRELGDSRKRDFSVTGSIKIVYIGTLNESKGVIWLMDQFARIKDRKIELHFAGKGPLKDKIECLADSNSQVHYHGFLNEKDLNILLRQCDALVAPSLWREPFGRIVLDAYKNAMPVLSSGYGGLGEIVSDGRTGIILNMEETDALEKAVNILRTPSKYNEFVDNVVRYIDNFSVEKQALQFEKKYRELLLNNE